MNWDAIIAITEIIGLLAVVISLIYVGFQVRQNTTQLRQDNLLGTVRGTLDANWFYHRDPEVFEVFRRGVHSCHQLEPQAQALFHSVIVDIAFYFEMVRNMEVAGLIDRSALVTNERFLGGILVTPGGREWLAFAEDTQPMPQPALEYLRKIVDSDGDELRPITELQPWFAEGSDPADP